MPTPTTLNEALAEIEVLKTQIQYLTEQAAIADAITNKVIPDNSVAINGVTNVLSGIATDVTEIAENTSKTIGLVPAAPAAPIIRIP